MTGERNALFHHDSKKIIQCVDLIVARLHRTSQCSRFSQPLPLKLLKKNE